MLETALTKRNYSLKAKITIKTLIFVSLAALAVVLPQAVHIALGAGSGVKWLPMYLPVLIGGCLLGAKAGLLLGVVSPIVSFAVTSAVGNPMPAAARLPYMIAELAVFAFVTGLFSEKIAKNGLFAFPAVWSAQVLGRSVFLLCSAVFGGSTLPFNAVLGQVKTGLIGLAAQAIIVPVIIILLNKMMNGEKAE